MILTFLVVSTQLGFVASLIRVASLTSQPIFSMTQTSLCLRSLSLPTIIKNPEYNHNSNREHNSFNKYKLQSSRCRKNVLSMLSNSKGEKYSPSNTALYSSDATTSSSSPPSMTTNTPKIVSDNFFRVIWDFTRPHTILGSGISVLSLYAFAVPPSKWFSFTFWKSISVSLFPALLMNIYITGLNQVTDVEIDRVNKPYLPIAAGKLSLNSGIAIILTCLFGSLFLGRSSDWPLQMTLIGSGILGTIYSLPPFRLKRYPFMAALCILGVRGALVNLGFYFQVTEIIYLFSSSFYCVCVDHIS